ncbi:hypothetical protein EBT16_13205 [bacterium]|nr:hypothetical protein [bacterium]
MKKIVFFPVLFFCMSFKALAFVPPVSSILKACFEGRKSGDSETVFRHQIQLKSGESMVVEERLAEIGGKVYVVFRSPSFGETGGTWSKGSYVFSGDKKFPSRSRAFVSYFTSSNGDQFREVLVDEKLLKRDQLVQYKPSFNPQGDPATWDLKENYVIQPQVYFSKTPQGPAIVAVGTQEGKIRKAVFFDKGTLLLSRIEWREMTQDIAWNFRGTKKWAGDGYFPEDMTFTLDGRLIIQSSLVSRQPLKEKSKSRWLVRFSEFSKSGMNSNLEEGLRILLGYR